MKMPVLLIVDDEKPTRDALRMGFQDDYEVYTAANLSQASAPFITASRRAKKSQKDFRRNV